MRLQCLFLTILTIASAEVLKLQLGKNTVPRPVREASGGYEDKPYELYETDFYTIPIEFGSPAQTLHLALNLGSNQFWVLDKNNSGNVATNGPTFDTSRSNSLKLNESELYFNFLGNVNVNGTRAQEDINLSSTTFKAQNVGVVRKATGEGTLAVSGVLGVGPTINGTDESGDSWEPIVHQIARKQSNGKFTVWLNSNEDSDVKGQLTFADHDGEHCEKEVVQAGTLKEHGRFSQWTFAISRYGAGKYHYYREGNVAIQNTDKIIKLTEYLYHSMSGIYRLSNDLKLNALTAYCREVEQFAPFSFTINGKDFEFPAQIMFKPLEQNKDLCRFLGESAESGFATEAFQLTQDFFKYVCVTYDVKNMTLAFSKAIAK
ncbi:unnamed protein product [Bursaphelenchus okinawaensis]|uniref:Peptidase A1 domain-containing protein n=1 Tax=Bursaphelenchus okinawaensis TaxID=465554 RepID=A0A811LEV8_9BILA|nr:unnamed protein product [Bursaphelenchus okinawaensis]CAG9121912.1 unnamed protein product [Bursaphelenchus okinawaensis]